MADIFNNLGTLRKKRGLSAIQLAAAAGVSRQTIHAIEAGTYVPNTAVALLLAKALDVTVEDLFSLANDALAAPLRSEAGEILPGSEPPVEGRAVQLCRVDKKLVAFAPAPAPWYVPPSDAVVSKSKADKGKLQLDIFHPQDDFSNRLLIAGCDPGISILSRHIQAAGIELVLAHRNSSQALTLLKAGYLHIAGTHLTDDSGEGANLSKIGTLFGKDEIAVIAFATWEEGILTAPGNPRQINTVADFARKDVRIVNREAGAGSRALLDTLLKRADVETKKIRGYDTFAEGHLPAAWQVKTGTADCCIATRAAAHLLGLHFIPLVSERYDLAIRRTHLDTPRVQHFLDVLSQSGFRRELESLGGYDTRVTGSRVL